MIRSHPIFLSESFGADRFIADPPLNLSLNNEAIVKLLMVGEYVRTKYAGCCKIHFD